MNVIDDPKIALEKTTITPTQFCVNQITSADGTIIKYGMLARVRA